MSKTAETPILCDYAMRVPFSLKHWRCRMDDSTGTRRELNSRCTPDKRVACSVQYSTEELKSIGTSDETTKIPFEVDDSIFEVSSDPERTWDDLDNQPQM